MNTATYRLIYSKARGCMMAVAETARASGKTSASTRRSHLRHPRRRFHKKNMLLV
jgi:Extended Signal Peptide of Type V secretion system